MDLQGLRAELASPPGLSRGHKAVAVEQGCHAGQGHLRHIKRHGSATVSAEARATGASTARERAMASSSQLLRCLLGSLRAAGASCRSGCTDSPEAAPAPQQHSQLPKAILSRIWLLLELRSWSTAAHSLHIQATAREKRRRQRSISDAQSWAFLELQPGLGSRKSGPVWGCEAC